MLKNKYLKINMRSCDIDKGEIVVLLSKFKRNDREIWDVGNKYLIKCMIVFELYKLFIVIGFEGCDYIFYVI